ncbi:MAG: endonuclease/exonuclease/phosphatase family protein [Bacteroidales bacterium]|nr:endonuclease/exonuclease/phosphatase family protein [Bacteroidales bacterium]
MKRKIITVFATICLSVLAIAANKPTNLTVMSYNIRYGTAKDGTNAWNLRYPASAMMIEDQKPDIMGIQEGLKDQLDYLKDVCKGYDYVGVGREDGKKEGEYSAILYNTKTVSIVKSGNFWLSEDPTKPSIGWDAACNRMATWAIMKDKNTGKKFMVVNTHLDHEGVEARKKGLELISSKISEINSENLPVILTGDFNMTPDSDEIKDLKKVMKDTREVAFVTDKNDTFNDWGKKANWKIIDYIFFSGFDSCSSYQTVTKEYYNRVYISDHFPIKAVFVL